MVKHKCQGCKERHVGCRAECESWLAYEKEKFKENERKNEALKCRDQLHINKYIAYKEVCKAKGKPPLHIDLFLYNLSKIDKQTKII